MSLPSPTAPPVSFADQVRALCEHRLDDPAFTVEWMAEACGLTRRHLLRRVVAETGQTPSALLRTARIARAETLLADGLPTDRVARAVGYRDGSAFRRAFRAVAGRAPGAAL